MAIKILWIYIVLLMLGGLMGFIKGKSKASLIASTLFAIPLVLCALNIIHQLLVAYLVIGFLALFFGSKYLRSKKLMPSGFMALLSLATLMLMLLNK